MSKERSGNCTVNSGSKTLTVDPSPVKTFLLKGSTTRQRLAVISVVTTTLVLLVVGWQWSRIEPTRSILPLEEQVARAPLGMTIGEAERYMGAKPDSVTVESGVLVSPVLMLAAENPKAAQAGPAREYTLRRWDRGGIAGVLAYDEAGRVVGKWSWQSDAENTMLGH
jgi:hypothetical protein